MKVLVLSPHADDAELGAGGSIVRFLERGDEIRWVVFSRAEASLPEGMPKDTVEREFETNMEELGLEASRYTVHRFPVRRLDEHRQEILDELVQINADYGPDLVLAPSLKDYHQDHQVVASETVRAFKTSASIICYELPWNHITFDTQYFVGLEREHVERKYALLQNYESQLAKGKRYFDEEFVFGLAKTRGVQSPHEYAEAFEVVRWLS